MNKILDFLSDYFAHRKGLLPILGILLVTANFIIELIWPGSWFATSDIFLHLGIIVAILGILLAWAL